MSATQHTCITVVTDEQMACIDENTLMMQCEIGNALDIMECNFHCRQTCKEILMSSLQLSCVLWGAGRELAKVRV